jgi:DNA-binding NarL/FixJ family response regulator
MDPLVRQVEALAQPRRNADSALTSRENEVAALVAQGLSNAAIARKLTLSERTVENHVSRALLKLGFNSRSALAVWYERRSGQLTPPMDRASSHPTASHARDL